MPFETKYVTPAARAPVLLERLRRSLPPDGEFPSNRIHSVYFDTPGLASLAEVDNGDYRKCKVRARWYEDGRAAEADAPRAFVECKAKTGTRRHKVRVEVPDLQRNLPLQHPAWLRLPALLRGAGAALPAGLWTPSLHITYRRHRFVDPASGVRLALDHEIRVARAHPRLMRFAAVGCESAPAAVFEVKGKSRALPAQLSFVTAMGARRQSFSKYGLWNEWIW